jgi:predicted  nucleic acid-binding Zn-ribbon protein
VIHLAKIEVRGTADAGEFSGVLELSSGLQVISARNAYGKSLAVKAIAWCFGLEPIFGNADNDPIRLPEAVREDLELAGHAKSQVVKSECSITIRDDSGRKLEITRSIKGGDPTVVLVRETESDGKTRESKLLARKLTMQDEHGGFQRFVFDWLKWPRVDVPTYRMGGSELYLENLAPLFYIDQNEGWTNIQALQIARYGQQEIGQIAVEYLLGALNAIKARVSRLQAAQRADELKKSARLITDQATDAMMRRGWRVEWSSHGSLKDVVARWSGRKLRQALKEDASVDIEARLKSINERTKALRNTLTKQPIDASNSSAPIAASQKAIELKEQRHTLNRDLHTLRSQFEQASSLTESLDHRLLAATDLLRLKRTGIGRLDHLECPTCHRDMDAGLFGLTSQSVESVGAHIEALKRDRELMRKNIESLSVSIKTTTASIEALDSELRDAERALMTVTSAVGPVREQLAATASELTAAERELERLDDAAKELDDIQASVDRWIADARAFDSSSIVSPDIESRRRAFIDALSKYLIALGHSAVRPDNAHLISLDDEYIPFMEGRRLRALGSASDQSRLVAAYSLALAATSQQMAGEHPGFVVLDEPLQQNPDESHRELFLTFLEKQLAQQSTFQTLIFTWLSAAEIARLRDHKTVVITPSGEHFLQLDVQPKEEDPQVSPAASAESSAASEEKDEGKGPAVQHTK